MNSRVCFERRVWVFLLTTIQVHLSISRAVEIYETLPMAFRQDFLKARLSKLPAQLPPELLNTSSNDDDGLGDDEALEELDDFDINGLGPTSRRDDFMKCVLPLVHVTGASCLACATLLHPGVSEREC